MSPRLLSSTWAWACSARHGLGSARLDIGRSTQYQPSPARLDFDSDLLGWTLTRTYSAGHQPWPSRLDIDLGPLDSILDLKDSAQHGPGPARLDIVMDQLGRLNIDHLVRLGPGLTRLRNDLTRL